MSEAGKLNVMRTRRRIGRDTDESFPAAFLKECKQALGRVERSLSGVPAPGVPGKGSHDNRTKVMEV